MIDNEYFTVKKETKAQSWKDKYCGAYYATSEHSKWISRVWESNLCREKIGHLSEAQCVHGSMATFSNILGL